VNVLCIGNIYMETNICERLPIATAAVSSESSNKNMEKKYVYNNIIKHTVIIS